MVMSKRQKTLRVGDFELSREVLAQAYAGKIIRAVYVPRGTPLAVKMVSLNEPVKKEAFDNEARISHICSLNENAIRVHKVFRQETHGFISMSLFDMTLNDLILDRRRLSGRRSTSIFRQIILGVAFMHERNIAHLNLSPVNILIVSRDQTAFVSDFGNSFLLETEQKIGEGLFQLGTRGEEGFQAPEVLIPGSFYNPVSADVWSLGVILLCMMTGFFFTTATVAAELAAIEGLNPQCRELVGRMVAIDPKRRPALRDVLEHPFMLQYLEAPRTPRSSITRLRDMIGSRR